MTSIHKSEIENQKCLVILVRDLRHRQRFPNLLNSTRDIEGVVSLMHITLPHVGPSSLSSRFSKPLSQTRTPCGISAFYGLFCGTCGTTGGGVFWHRPPEPDARSHWDRLWDFSIFRHFLWDVWEKRGWGWDVWQLGTQHSELRTQNSELGTRLPTCNLQRATSNRFSPGYPGLVC
jgi:hypothetical protein